MSGFFRHLWSAFVTIVLKGPAIFISTLAFAAASVAASLVDPRGELQASLARSWGRAFCFITGVRLEVEGLENLEVGCRYIFAVNHESYLDTPVLLACLPGRIRFLAKEGLWSLPGVGWHLRSAGHIPVSRRSPHHAARSAAHASRRIQAEDLSIIVFPEGGRTAAGQMRTFHDGAGYIAIKSSTAIVPVALCGTADVWPIHGWVIRSGNVRVKIGSPIQTGDLRVSERTALTQHVHAVLAALREGGRDNSGRAICKEF